MDLAGLIDDGLYAHTDRYTVKEEPEGAVNTTVYVDDTVAEERYVVQAISPAERWRVQKSVHLLEALDDVQTPTPPVRYDGSESTVPFYVMDRVPGVSARPGYRERGVDPAARLAEQVGEALGAAHEAMRLDWYGRVTADDDGLRAFDDVETWPEAYQVQATLWLDMIDDHTNTDIGHLQEAVEDAVAAMPEEPVPTLLHNDCRPGNVLHVDGDLTAVVDWDNAIAGDAGYEYVRTEDAFADWFGEEGGPVREAFRQGYGRHADPVQDEDLYQVYRFASYLDKVGGCAFALDGGRIDQAGFDQMMDWLQDRVERFQNR